ncbi:MAG: TerC family protein [Acetobacteraceae bacterium]
MLSELTATRFWLDLAEITGINIMLSGDNAVVIALACRSLPLRQRNWAVIGGSAGAILLRVLFCLVIVWLLRVPYLKLIGGLLLLWIGVKLIVPEDGDGEGGLSAKSNLFGAMQTIMIADAVMSLDNVVAIAAVARDSVLLIVLGLVISVPLIVFGSQLVLRFLVRFPLLVTLGGGLLGWIAGEIITGDDAVERWVPAAQFHTLEQVAQPVLAVLVMAIGTLLARRAASRPKEVADLASEERK